MQKKRRRSTSITIMTTTMKTTIMSMSTNIIMNMMNGAISDLVHAAFLGSEHLDMAACRDLLRSVEGVYFPKYTVKIDEDQLKAMTQQDFTDLFTAAAADYYAKKEAEITPPVMRELERVILLRVVDEYWMEHIDAMQDLRQGIRLRAYAQTNPVDAYKKESLEMFEEMVNAMKEETVRRLHPKKQVAGVLISLLVLAGLGWTCTRVDMGYICGCIALVAGVLKYRNIIQFNSLTVQRFRNTYKDEMDLNKYNKYVDSHF